MASEKLRESPIQSGLRSSKLKAQIDQQLDELFQDILPTVPYLRRVQQDQRKPLPPPLPQPYWWHGTLFTKGEQELQYVTFHPEPLETTRSHGQWDDGNGGLEVPESAQSHQSSGRTPLQTQGVKKKISIFEYKNRGKSQSIGKNTDTTDTIHRADKPLHNDEEHAPLKVNGTTTIHTQDKRLDESFSSLNKDNQLPSAKVESDEKSPSQSITGKSPSAKRRRLSEDSRMDDILKQPEALEKERSPVKSAECSDRNQKSDDLNVPTNILRRQSPGTKPRTPPPSNGRQPNLPKMLSPTLPGRLADSLPPLLSPGLPPEIEEALAEAERQRPKDPMKSLNKTHPAKNGVSTRPSSRQETRPSHIDSQSRKVGNKRNGWIRLKFRGGQHRKTLASILNEESRRVAYKKGRSGSARDTVGSNHANHAPDRSGTSAAQPPIRTGVKKRQRSQSSENYHDSRSSPHAPDTPSIKKARLAHSAPSANTLRMASSQDNAITPLGTSRYATPSTPSKQDFKIEYRSESDRLRALGRKLKHESDKYTKIDQPTKKQLQSAMIIGLEAVLTFMLAFSVYDEPAKREQKVGYVDHWETIRPYLCQVVGQSEGFPLLTGFASQLEAIVHETIKSYSIYNLRGCLRDDEETVSHQQLQEIRQHTSRMFSSEIKAAAAWRYGYAKLRHEELQQSFPKTWARARPCHTSTERNDTLTIGHYSKVSFALPMGTLTTGIEAVNAGMCLLEEYCQTENIDRKFELVL